MGKHGVVSSTRPEDMNADTELATVGNRDRLNGTALENELALESKMFEKPHSRRAAHTRTRAARQDNDHTHKRAANPTRYRGWPPMQSDPTCAPRSQSDQEQPCRPSLYYTLHNGDNGSSTVAEMPVVVVTQSIQRPATCGVDASGELRHANHAARGPRRCHSA